jgi:predicted RND superfamily exporter protein
MPVLKKVKTMSEESSGKEMAEVLVKGRDAAKQRMEKLKAANTLSEKDKKRDRMVISFYDDIPDVSEMNGNEAFTKVKEAFDNNVAGLKDDAEKKKERLKNVFAFIEEVFGDAEELLIFVTELTVSDTGARFISQFGSQEYEEASKKLMLSERKNALRDEILALDI